MKCHVCPFEHRCRTDLEICPSSRLDQGALRDFYAEEDNQRVVQAAAKLVDGGRAGTLSRLEEIIEYAHELGYRRLGVAYCFCMEQDAGLVTELIRAADLRCATVSCTAGAMAQQDINEQSGLPGVSCNPAGQAAQLKSDRVEIVLTMGLCLGHDLLLNKQLDVPVTTLVVKDRTSGHNPLQAVRDLHARTLGDKTVRE